MQGSPARRFQPPWSIDEANDACFIVRDKNGQALGYFYFEFCHRRLPERFIGSVDQCPAFTDQSVKPCGVLREAIRQRGDLAANFPNGPIDFGFEAQFGAMSAKR